MKNNELLREEWRKEYQPDRYIADINKNVESTADWWLSKIDSLKAELVDKFEDIPEASMKEAHNSSVISREEAIKLIKEL